MTNIQEERLETFTVRQDIRNADMYVLAECSVTKISEIYLELNKHCKGSCELLRYTFRDRFEMNFEVVSNLFQGSQLKTIKEFYQYFNFFNKYF